MAEFKCPNCGGPLESEDELCTVCDASPASAKSPSKMAPPPPAKTPAPAPAEHTVPKVVGDIMTRKLATLFEGEALDEAAKGLRKVKFRHVPVVGPEGFFIGLVSQRDILRALPSALESDANTKALELLKKHRVGDIMARNVKTVSVDTTLADAGRIMIDEKRDCLPVTDDKGNLIGLVTATDYIRLAVTFLEKD